MGVPAFFRWLSRKYVSIIVDAVEERRREHDGIKVPINCTEPNPNFQEFDNLYLDMNGIIHPCTHPEDRPAPKTEEEMFILIFEYIDRLFSIVRPRKLLYMAIDGVAPRAKMNQQRSRRFRASKETAEKLEQIANTRKKLEDEGIPLPPPRKEEEHFDSNCITPGTPFMARLSSALRYYIHKRMTYDPAWQKIQVILSDANVPGEGEHKIMDYIRRQRASPGHNPNTVHCLCGADADLIMLGLATHEANFNIIREEFVPNQPKACELCGQYGHELDHCQGLARAEAGPDQADPLKKEKNFIFIRLPVLREYLERELFMENLPIPFDLERAIDDWVMMCFFVGNDFLPHLPSLEIRENAIDRLIKLYKNMIYQTGGWLTHDGDVNIERVKMIMIELGKVEDEIFKERQLRDLRFKESQKQKNQRAKQAAALLMPYNARFIAPQPISAKREYISGDKIREMAADDRKQLSKDVEQQARKLKSLLQPTPSLLGFKRKAEQKKTSESPTGSPPAKSFKDEELIGRKTEEAGPKPTIVMTTPSGKPTPLAKGAVGALVPGDNDSDEEPEDGIRLWEAGWKDRYYQAKFDVPESDLEFRKKVACAYMEGLSWVLRYYYQGCASWTWFYPFHYAPFASDFELIGDFHPDFSKPTKPFKPLEQLMGVFPAASRAHIPESWRWLMIEQKSPIIDFYPENFEIDLNGKKYAWQGVALLPFVDEKRLLDALDLVYDKLNPEEQARNTTGPDRLFIGKHHELFDLIHKVHTQGKLTNTSKNDDSEEGKQQESTISEIDMNGSSKKMGIKNEDLHSENGLNAQDLKHEHDPSANGEKPMNESSCDEKQWILIDATKAFGMSGEVSHDVNSLAYGESHISMFKNSLEFGDIKNNSCIMVEFRDPQFPAHFRFKASRLEGINDITKVLKPGDYDERRQGKFRPQIGFTRDIPHASLSSPGHRTLNHHINEQRQQQYSRRSGPSTLHCYQQQTHNTQPLPWHIGHSFAPQTTQMSNLTPMPLNFMQMAMPPPPTPPQSWIMQQSHQQFHQEGGGYIAQWGQPPTFTSQQHRSQHQQQIQHSDNTWRRHNQNQWSSVGRYQQQQQQNLPYHRNDFHQNNNNGGNNRNQQWQQQAHSTPRESRATHNNRR